MRPDEILDAMSGIRDRFLLSADGRRQNPKGKKNAKLWIRWAAGAACIVLIAGIALRVLNRNDDSVLTTETEESAAALASPYAVETAVYPETVPYPNEADYWETEDWDGYSEAMQAWAAGRQWKYETDLDPLSAMDGCFTRMTRQFVGADSDENRVFSPLNVYMALAMLAETADGDSRAQILDLLGAPDVETLRDTAELAWRLTYTDDGMVTQVLADSLWLNENVQFRESTLETLAERYFASSYQGEMGSRGFDEALQNWLNEQTGGLLKDEASQITLDPSTILALASTVYFKGSWQDEFPEARTSPDVFHGAKGDEQADFMRQSGLNTCYRGENFAAVPLRFRNAGQMWLILPDEGVSNADVLAGDEVFPMLLHPESFENSRTATVNLSVPKFDVKSTADLIDGLQALGVTDVFDPSVSDFTPLAENMEGLCVSEASHSARVTIDEEGCTAAAFTVMVAEESAMESPEEIDFTLDRPFLFAITTREGLLLFTGAVETLE